MSSDEEFNVEDAPEGLSAMTKFLSRHRTAIAQLILLICLLSYLYYAVTVPRELYRAYGDIVRIDENGMDVDIARVGVHVNPDAVPMTVEVSRGICFLNPDFGLHRCGLGAHVELVMYANYFKEFWYIDAVLGSYDDYGVEKKEA